MTAELFWTGQTDYYGVPVVELHGELDARTAGPAWDTLRYVIVNHPRVIVNLDKLEFCDCAGLRVLMRAEKRCAVSGGWLILCSPRGIVAKLLSVMNMDVHFIIWEDAP